MLLFNIASILLTPRRARCRTTCRKRECPAGPLFKSPVKTGLPSREEHPTTALNQIGTNRLSHFYTPCDTIQSSECGASLATLSRIGQDADQSKKIKTSNSY